MALELHPLEQFAIARIIPIHIGGLDLSYTNAALMMTIAVVLVTALMVLATRRAALVPGRWQSVAEMLYEFVADMVDSNIGQGGRQFFPFVFTLFTFILFANLLGMIPYSYTTTGQIIVTFALAAVVFILVTAIGIIRHGFHFLSLFVPQGVPKVLLLLAGADRTAVLLHPPVHPLDPALREYAGRTHDAGDFRRLCREHRSCSHSFRQGSTSCSSAWSSSSRCCRLMCSPS